jgi:hypothetical protein
LEHEEIIAVIDIQVKTIIVPILKNKIKTVLGMDISFVVCLKAKKNLSR